MIVKRHPKKWISLSLGGKRGVGSFKEVAEAFTPEGPGDKRPGRLSLTYGLKGLWADPTPFGRRIYTSFDLPGAGFLETRGGPRLIRETLLIDLPPWAELKKVEISFNEFKMLEGTFIILPATENALEGSEVKMASYPKYYDKDENFPEKMVEYAGVTNYLGRHCARLQICPMQYNPITRKVSVVQMLILEMTYGPMEKVPSRPKATAPPAEALEIPSVRQLAKPWSQLIITGDKAAQKSQPENTGGRSRLVIVTTEKFKPLFEDYVKARSPKYNISFLLRENIQKTYPDVPLDYAVKLVLMGENKNEPIDYVLIGGNTLRIPTHLINIEYKGEIVPVASDSWYAMAEDSATTPLFAVGRMPASSLDEMERLISQALYWFDLEPNEKYRHNMLLRAFNTPGHIKCSEQVAHMAKDAGLTVIKCYDQPYKGVELIDKIKQPVGFVNYRGHGRTSGWLGRGHFPDNFFTEDLGRLRDRNDDSDKEKYPSIIYSMACWTAAIHHDKGYSFGEAWLLSSMAVSFMGFSAPTYTIVNDLISKYTWEAITRHQLRTAGDVWRWALLSVLKQQAGAPTDHNVRTCLLLGDPTIDIPDLTLIESQKLGLFQPDRPKK